MDGTVKQAHDSSSAYAARPEAEAKVDPEAGDKADAEAGDTADAETGDKAEADAEAKAEADADANAEADEDAYTGDCVDEQIEAAKTQAQPRLNVDALPPPPPTAQAAPLPDAEITAGPSPRATLEPAVTDPEDVTDHPTERTRREVVCTVSETGVPNADLFLGLKNVTGIRAISKYANPEHQCEDLSYCSRPEWLLVFCSCDDTAQADGLVESPMAKLLGHIGHGGFNADRQAAYDDAGESARVFDCKYAVVPVFSRLQENGKFFLITYRKTTERVHAHSWHTDGGVYIEETCIWHSHEKQHNRTTKLLLYYFAE